MSVCDLQNKDLKVVIHSITSQAIDLSGSQLAVEIPGHSGSPFIVPFPHTLLVGNTYDTITLSNINLDMGSYTIKTYPTVPVDIFPVNDTAIYTVDIRPALAVRVINTTNQMSPVDAGWLINQRLTVTNTGNVPLSDIRLRLYVLVNAQPSAILEQTLTGITIVPGDSLSNFTFTEAYTVPWVSIYGIMVEALGCDSAKIHASNSAVEYANTDDLELLQIDNPSGSGLDTIGSSIHVKISLRNKSLVHNFEDVRATVIIRGSNGVATDMPYTETIPFQILLSSDTSFTFTQTYIVPNDIDYSITVFIGNIFGNALDNFRTNDTARVTRRTTASIGITNIEGNGNGISMSQNIPNPSNGATRIDYSLPTDGEVTFHVYTISGQELFNQVVETTSGKHSIDLNTTSLASGIYFYSMEFKGQRIVKRMSVNN
jgi:hypothetical protein